MVVRTDTHDVESEKGRFVLRERRPYFWAEPAAFFEVLLLGIYYCIWHGPHMFIVGFWMTWRDGGLNVHCDKLKRPRSVERSCSTGIS